MLFFDPSTHEYFHSVDAFFKHISTSGQGLDEWLAMVEAWRKASVKLYLEDVMGSVRQRELGAAPPPQALFGHHGPRRRCLHRVRSPEPLGT